ncbi:sigma-70 family RNA polymerase sigma factor [Verrucomicrobiaceae bacterium N1E253]|uniref:Sigma-70 family RNA polymerase sigma factor n=1 Tax=Oceaniferula marina TaxID=2748318 RepID=A0A851GM81_9BACT|nr:sigma-70 family RNA polymerase sigma factor [Oceaniferula marina]NWK56941.1 sigma-70 family RNA polymerase sigma factor [Oceaniferula marina]
MSDTLQRSNEGEPQLAFTRLLIANERALYGFLLSLVHDRSAADDLLQELAGRLWRKFDEYDSSRPFIAWGIGFARLLAFEWRRKQQKLPIPMDDEILNSLADASAEHAEQYDERRSYLLKCMKGLTERQRQALHAHYFDEQPVKKIARLWQRTEMAVYKILKRAHKAMFDCMRESMANTLGKGGDS